MPPVGSWTAIPSLTFAFPRGYISWFEWFVNSDNDVISFDGEIFTIGSHGFPSIVQYVKLKPGWWQWDARGFRLGDLVTNYWYTIAPSPTEIPNAGLVIHFLWDDVIGGWGIQFQKELPDTHIPFVLEQAPTDYWLYPVPGA